MASFSPLLVAGSSTSPPAAVAAAASGSSSVTVLDTFPVSQNTGQDPQSKVWEHAGTWFCVMPSSGGTYIWRLDANTWHSVLKIASGTSWKADAKEVGNVTHILLDKGGTTQLASVEYVPGSPGTYKMWSQRPAVATISTKVASETVTLDIDSQGRLWIAEDDTTSIQVRYSDAPYATWSQPIVLANNLDRNFEDLSVITAMPNHTIGVLWSNHGVKRFGFRVHVDSASPTTWQADEVPASQSVLSPDVGHGIADDHLNVAVASDGTLYAAVKTAYDSSKQPVIGLLVRRPPSAPDKPGTWDPLYGVDSDGTRPLVLLNEAVGQVLVVYAGHTGQSDVVYKQVAVSQINPANKTALSSQPRKTLIGGGNLRQVSSTKQNVTDDVVIISTNSSNQLAGARLEFEDNNSGVAGGGAIANHTVAALTQSAPVSGPSATEKASNTAAIAESKPRDSILPPVSVTASAAPALTARRAAGRGMRRTDVDGQLAVVGGD